jgi:hypothetical protein
MTAADTTRRLYPAPNKKTIAIQRWRFALVKECLGIISMAEGQAVENRALARMVGQDPRALRQMLAIFPQVRIMIDPKGKRGLWYGLNPDGPKFEIPGNVPPPENPVYLVAKSSNALIECEGES